MQRIKGWLGSKSSGAKMSHVGSLQVSMCDRYKAAMVLSGAGDALGYKCGDWEFCHSGCVIHDELKNLGGLANVKVSRSKWPVSDDTVMHLATAEALIENGHHADRPMLYSTIGQSYKDCMKDMGGRAPGLTCMSILHYVKPKIRNGHKVDFNPRGGGCGAAMRAMCIGLRYPRPEDLDDLVAVSIESGRMTHHHPTGYLGSLAAALFTAYSIQGKPPVEWGTGLLEVLERAKNYIKKEDHFTKENLNEWPYFQTAWENYIDERKLKSGTPSFPEGYDTPEVRDKFYKKISYSGWGGSSGHDSTIIAYDAILGAGQDWEELCKRGVFHGGDSDSTGTIAACCYGAMYGFEGVPDNNYKKLEYRERLEKCAEDLYKLAYRSDSQTKSEEPNPVKLAEASDSTAEGDQDRGDAQPPDSQEPMEALNNPGAAAEDDGGQENELTKGEKDLKDMVEKGREQNPGAAAEDDGGQENELTKGDKDLEDMVEKGREQNPGAAAEDDGGQENELTKGDKDSKDMVEKGREQNVADLKDTEDSGEEDMDEGTEGKKSSTEKDHVETAV